MTQREFALALTKLLESLPDDEHDEAEATVAAALDETGGDYEATLKLARKILLPIDKRGRV